MQRSRRRILLLANLSPPRACSLASDFAPLYAGQRLLTRLRPRQATLALGRLLQRCILFFAGRNPRNMHCIADHVRRASLPLRSFWHVSVPFWQRRFGAAITITNGIYSHLEINSPFFKVVARRSHTQICVIRVTIHLTIHAMIFSVLPSFMPNNSN